MFHGMSVLAAIPARLASTRLPDKLLLSETGKPLIQHTLERVLSLDVFDDVLVATDSADIEEIGDRTGARSVLTGNHPSGTDRIVEALSACGTQYDIVVNVQGDEPEITEPPILAMLESLASNPDAVAATAATRFESIEQLQDPSCVKAVVSHSGKALYFSRSVIPSFAYHELQSADLSDGPWHRHIGLYAYRIDFLMNWPTLPESHLQRVESLEQLKVLDAGYQMQVVTVDAHPVGIDTRRDYEAFIRRAAHGHF